MTPQHQRYTGYNPDAQGDCHRTCIAMILDLYRDEVPHFMRDCAPGLPPDHPNSRAAEAAERAWLAERGLAPVYVPFDGSMPLEVLVEQFNRFARGTAVILGCSSGGVDHSVVLHNGKIHNPNHGDVTGPMLDGMWWVTILSPTTSPLHEPTSPATVATQEVPSDGS